MLRQKNQKISGCSASTSTVKSRRQSATKKSGPVRAHLNSVQDLSYNIIRGVENLQSDWFEAVGNELEYVGIKLPKCHRFARPFPAGGSARQIHFRSFAGNVFLFAAKVGQLFLINCLWSVQSDKNSAKAFLSWLFGSKWSRPHPAFSTIPRRLISTAFSISANYVA